MDKKLKEFELTRTTTTYEKCFVMATDLEDAEEKGSHHVSKKDWEETDYRQEVDAEEVSSE